MRLNQLKLKRPKLKYILTGFTNFVSQADSILGYREDVEHFHGPDFHKFNSKRYKQKLFLLDEDNVDEYNTYRGEFEDSYHQFLRDQTRFINEHTFELMTLNGIPLKLYT